MKCARTACPREAHPDCISGEGRVYCVSCAHKINRYAGRKIVNTPKPNETQTSPRKEK